MRENQLQLCSIPKRHCLQCYGEIKLENRRKLNYSNRNYCTHECYLNYLKENGNSNTSSHKMSKTRQWTVYSAMKRRCNNKNNKRYGGRGITYCDKWKTFNGFWKDMEEGYKDYLTLDRIDNDGNYCKENCRWTTNVQQANNRKTNVILFRDGIGKTISEWAREIGIKPMTISWRYKHGWDINKILDKQVCRKHYKNR